MISELQDCPIALPNCAETLLIVDDNETFLTTLERYLSRRGLAVKVACNADEAERIVREDRPDGVILDLNLGKISGLQLIPRLLEIRPMLRIVVLTGYASIATAVEAVRLGAVNYLSKPADIDAILSAFDAKPGNSKDDHPDTSPMSIRQLEWEHLQRVLLDHDGNISSAARALGLHRRSLQRKLKKHAPA
jgi:two-component system response regulator RegA